MSVRTGRRRGSGQLEVEPFWHREDKKVEGLVFAVDWTNCTFSSALSDCGPRAARVNVNASIVRAQEYAHTAGLQPAVPAQHSGLQRRA